MLMAVLERERWHWSCVAVVAVTVPFLAIDLSFFAANIVKIFDGGWFPLVVAVIVYTLMTTWHTGRTILTQRLAAQSLSIDDFLRDLKNNVIPRVPGTAIFMSRSRAGIPITLLHNLKHNKVVHQNVVLLNIEVEETARGFDANNRFEWEELGSGVFRLIVHVGFIEDPNLPELLSQVKGPISFSPMTTSYFLGRETLIATNAPGMALWRDELFVWMSRNASSASQYFALPPNQVIELGAQIEM
jgi:KUP system potassium uptake protein